MRSTYWDFSGAFSHKPCSCSSQQFVTWFLTLVIALVFLHRCSYLLRCSGLLYCGGGSGVSLVSAVRQGCTFSSKHTMVKRQRERWRFNPPYWQLTCEVEKSVLYPPCNFTTVCFIYLNTCRASLHVGLKVELECLFLTLEMAVWQKNSVTVVTTNGKATRCGWKFGKSSAK